MFPIQSTEMIPLLPLPLTSVRSGHWRKYSFVKRQNEALNEELLGTYLPSFFKCAILGLFFVYFCLFKQTLEFLQKIYVKNVHSLNGAGIWTHDLQNMSFLP